MVGRAATASSDLVGLMARARRGLPVTIALFSRTVLLFKSHINRLPSSDPMAMRTDGESELDALFLCPTTKEDGMQYLRLVCPP